ncbi:MAG: acyl-CoA dehydrogenase family protein [Polyangiaceae bacterium]
MEGTITGLERLAFELSEEQKLAAEMAREFATRRIAPGAAKRDQSGVFPSEELREAAGLGLLAMRVPVPEGGAGLDTVGYALCMEAIAEACASVAVVLASSNLSAKILSDYGTPAQKTRWLTPYVRGEAGPLSFALSEPGCGSDASALTTSARRDGDGFVLDGSKMWTTGASHAHVHLVFARSDGPGKRGISLFAVPRDTPGLTLGKDEDKMGQRASGTAPLSLEACRIPADHLIGRAGGGYGIALSALAPGRAGIAALSIGLGEAALGAGRAYADERRAFGQRLTEFQNTPFVLADCRTELDAAWLLTLRAAKLVDLGDRAVAESSMAKLFASEAAGRVVDRMLQVHGGYGYSREFLVERLYRDIRVTRIYEGTSEVQRLVVARELAGPPA